MAGTLCTRCFRDATVHVIGTFRNGRPAVDPRCDHHIPDPEDMGKFLLFARPDGAVTGEYRALEVRRLVGIVGKVVS